jgi:hypothetical protein
MANYFRAEAINFTLRYEQGEASAKDAYGAGVDPPIAPTGMAAK